MKSRSRKSISEIRDEVAELKTYNYVCYVYKSIYTANNIFEFKSVEPLNKDDIIYFDNDTFIISEKVYFIDTDVTLLMVRKCDINFPNHLRNPDTYYHKDKTDHDKERPGSHQNSH